MDRPAGRLEAHLQSPTRLCAPPHSPSRASRPQLACPHRAPAQDLHRPHPVPQHARSRGSALLGAPRPSWAEQGGSRRPAPLEPGPDSPGYSEDAGGDTFGGGAVEGWETVAESNDHVAGALGGADVVT